MDKCVRFLNEIGIRTEFRNIDGRSFLPGLSIERGRLVIDLQGLAHVGDILHEAGHIAVVTGDERVGLDEDAITNSKNREAEEMMAIAWSYAACVHLGMDPLIVFHEAGYKGGGMAIVENFRAGRYLGLPMLQWCKMAKEPGLGVESAYPAMLRWVRE
ncbi:MAG: hypothetical protein JST68_26965 [Bacteroidetes bacterium]|nr:hypothetical protein [Bacteroidota bacterium]